MAIDRKRWIEIYEIISSKKGSYELFCMVNVISRHVFTAFVISLTNKREVVGQVPIGNDGPARIEKHQCRRPRTPTAKLQLFGCDEPIGRPLENAGCRGVPDLEVFATIRRSFGWRPMRLT
jgi:hypothetical protein